ncbi:hypothetical protein [Halorussus ruber]|uniref:hypothetical protein n=1 Tax=Halorussus ruber TaxID=1126238 RepID=UPI001091C053|nr:hypothetical protein [Halorussus ruber]
MNRIRAFAAVCVLVVLVGSSASFALGDVSRDAAESSAQIAAQTGETGSVSVEIMPEKNRILRNQPMNFAVRVVSDGGDILLGLRVHSETPTTFEFHNPDVEVISISWLYPNFDAVAYIPERSADREEYIPVTISPEKKLPQSSSTVEATYISRDVPVMPTAEFTFGIRCPAECHAELMVQWVGENIGSLLTLLGLLIAFFGRKQIWDALGLPREHEEEVEVETGERPDAGTADSEPPEADAVSDGQRPEG